MTSKAKEIGSSSRDTKAILPPPNSVDSNEEEIEYEWWEKHLELSSKTL